MATSIPLWSSSLPLPRGDVTFYCYTIATSTINECPGEPQTGSREAQESPRIPHESPRATPGDTQAFRCSTTFEVPKTSEDLKTVKVSTTFKVRDYFKNVQAISNFHNTVKHVEFVTI